MYDLVDLGKHLDEKKPIIEYITKITFPNDEVIEKIVSTVEIFPSLRIRTNSHSCVYTKTSKRNAIDILNQYLGRTDINIIKLRTLSDSICRIGTEISEELSNVTAHILTMYGFDDESGLPLEHIVLSDSITTVTVFQDKKPGKPEMDEVIAAINDFREEKIPFSAAEIKIESVPEECVYVSIDDIDVKHQKNS